MKTERTLENNEWWGANSSRETHLFAWSIADVFLNQGNVESARMNEPFALHASTSHIAIGAVINLYCSH